MKFITNSTETQAIGVSDAAGVVVIELKDSDQGLALHIRVDRVLRTKFELGTLEELQAKAAAIIEALT